MYFVGSISKVIPLTASLLSLEKFLQLLVDYLCGRLLIGSFFLLREVVVVNIVRMVVDLLVVISGFLSFLVLFPQITLLLRVKRSDSISPIMVGGSILIQSPILVQAILHGNWPLVFTMSMSIAGLAVILMLIYKYRLGRVAVEKQN